MRQINFVDTNAFRRECIGPDHCLVIYKIRQSVSKIQIEFKNIIT
jgi:hypothetical protein